MAARVGAGRHRAVQLGTGAGRPVRHRVRHRRVRRLQPPGPAAADFTRHRIDTLFGLLDELGIERAHLVGNSMGGIIGLGMALQNPERIGRTVPWAAAARPSRPPATC
ncbi:alpha/beta fold hydrolase [Actinomadura sp. CNU-125]|uniref:alpha/beta fold hydrolase n=1 Tax=Actinomadura sp. CNU-125 TaxID=1904961 RepID=UPI00096A73D6|nr:alpha/beta fold hydrolase [Actinomadura sp. CNU-125]